MKRKAKAEKKAVRRRERRDALGVGGVGEEGGKAEVREGRGSLSSSLQSLSLSASGSASVSSRGSAWEEGEDSALGTERRMKAKRERKLGYKLCRVSGCLEVRAKEGHRKYCAAHQGIHTQGNPNERKGQQRRTESRSGRGG